MVQCDKDSNSGCGNDCTHCHTFEVKGGLEGWRFVLPAAAAFGLPLAMALTGAALAAGQPARQALWALGGLALGVILAVALNTIFRPQSRTHGQAASTPANEESS